MAGDVEQIILRFPEDPDRKISRGLSGVEQVGRTLFLVSDETAGIEALQASPGGIFDRHKRWSLSELGFRPEKVPGEKPEEEEEEADLEGLCADGGWLWVIGSHSRKRGKIEDDDDRATVLKELHKDKLSKNRLVLGRVPLVGDGKGGYELAEDAKRRPSFLAVKGRSNDLLERLRADDLLSPFCASFTKENGLDIEGLAVRDTVAFLGLRGPVLRERAIVVSAKLKFSVGSPATVDGGIHTHFLPLGGRGIRDLVPAGDDLLVLAGPTMALDGPMVLYRWRGGLTSHPPGPNECPVVDWLFEVPKDGGKDHAEGVCFFKRKAEPTRLLVVYDSPSDARLDAAGRYHADLFETPDVLAAAADAAAELKIKPQ